VNDLYYHDKKIAGILTEAVTNIEAQKVDALIVGMGINLHIDDAIIPEDLKPIKKFQTVSAAMNSSHVS